MIVHIGAKTSEMLARDKRLICGTEIDNGVLEQKPSKIIDAKTYHIFLFIHILSTFFILRQLKYMLCLFELFLAKL